MLQEEQWTIIGQWPSPLSYVSRFHSAGLRTRNLTLRRDTPAHTHRLLPSCKQLHHPRNGALCPVLFCSDIVVGAPLFFVIFNDAPYMYSRTKKGQRQTALRIPLT